MIKKFEFGNPINTEAVLEAQNKINRDTNISGYLQTTQAETGMKFSRMLDKDAVIYGLGQNVRGINKRGWIYESKCSDDPFHSEDKRSLYGAHNFIIIDNKDKAFGIFIDHPGKVVFDIGYTKTDELIISIPDKDGVLYIIEAENKETIVSELRKLTGRSYIPPKWAFGYGQSRWSYMNADEVRQVAAKHRENKIPLDSIYLDIDYMDNYKDFTINKETFPDFKSLVLEMKKQGIHLVPIIDAGVKIDGGYDVYEEGVERDYFCKNEKGENFVAGVWPGRVHFPDMLNGDVRRWFGKKYEVLLNEGIDGFWNDMNEPAIFYSEEHLKEVFEKIEEYKGKNLDIQSFFAFKNMIGDIDNNEEDYKRFYHTYHGEKIRHDKVHNLYGYYMTRAAGEAFFTLCPEKRILMFSRSSYIGMHRYGGIWMGDNLSWWSHLLLNIHMLPSLNMCGFLYTGADLGGFGADATEDLLLRWLQFGIFTPLMRNHSAMGTRRQEVYLFEHTEVFKNIVSIRYGLLPYLYSEFMKAALQDGMYCKPLSFVYPHDAHAKKVEDQLMIGESIMIVPVYEQNASGRYVYLPEEMKMIRFMNLTSREETVLSKGHHYIDFPLEEVVLFIRPNHILPFAENGGMNVEEVDFENLTLLSFVKEKAEYIYYNDNGYDKNYEKEDNFKIFELV